MGVFRRLTACLILFCANPLAFLRGLGEPHGPLRRLLSQSGPAAAALPRGHLSEKAVDNGKKYDKMRQLKQ